MPLPRYRLQPYDGRKTRYPCPACGTCSTFTRYLDTLTNVLLPDAYGRCNRADKCAYHLNPYHRAADGGPSYATLTERGERLTTPLLPLRPLAPPAPSLVLPFPLDVFTATLGHYDRNALAAVLRRHFGPNRADALLQRFQVGTCAHWPGACIFWLIDERNRVRGGQVVLFDATGHTVKARPDGTRHRHITWAHTALAAAYHKRRQAVPAWLIEYDRPDNPKSPCLFGLSQLATAPPTAPVALVESAKSAIVATAYLPQYVWLATMGKSFLTADRLAPLRGRRIVLFPDVGALDGPDGWQAKADKLRAAGFRLDVFDGLERRATEAERRAGLDLADVLLRPTSSPPPIGADCRRG